MRALRRVWTRMESRYEFIAKVWIIIAVIAAVVWIMMGGSIRGCGPSPCAFDIIILPGVGPIVATDLSDEEVQSISTEESWKDLDVVCSVRIWLRPRSEFAFLSTWTQSVGDSQVNYHPMWGSEDHPEELDFKQILLDAAEAEPLTEVTAYEFQRLRNAGVLAAMKSTSGTQYTILPASILKDVSLIIFIVGAFASFVYRFRYYTTRSKLDDSRCPNCAYPKLGLPDSITTCPECGQPFTQRSPELNVLGAEIKSAR